MADAKSRELQALVRIERAVDLHLGRSSWTQTKDLKGFGYSQEVRTELFAAHDEVRDVLANPSRPREYDCVFPACQCGGGQCSMAEPASPPVAVQEEGDAKDAARYRWLREEAQHFPRRAPAVVLCDESDFFEKGDASSDHGFISGSRLDAAIDAAMKGDQP